MTKKEENGWILYLGFLAFTIVVVVFGQVCGCINEKRAEEAEYRRIIGLGE